jgi:hypothetical protein
MYESGVTNLLSLLTLGQTLLPSLFLALAFFQQGLWDEDLVLGRGGSAS